MLYRSQAIILKKTDWGEAGQLFTFYTAGFGKVTAAGRGTKKVTSKLNGHLQFFSVIDTLFASGKRVEQLTGALMIKNFPTIKQDLKKTVVASYGLELLDRFTPEGQRDDRLYAVLNHLLEQLEIATDEHEKLLNIKNEFTIQLLTILGYRPPLDIAISGQRQIGRAHV